MSGKTSMIRDRWIQLPTQGFRCISSCPAICVFFGKNFSRSKDFEESHVEVKPSQSVPESPVALGWAAEVFRYISLFLGFIHRSWVLPLSTANHFAFVVHRCSRISICGGTCCVGELPFFLFFFFLLLDVLTVVTSPQSSQSRLWLFLCNFPYIIPSDRRREFLWILTYPVSPNHMKG